MTTPRPLITLLLSLYALTVLGVIGFIVYRSVGNDGLMPRPSALLRYECPAPGGAYAFYFRHGRDQVQIRSAAGTLHGVVHDRQLSWSAESASAALFPGTLPQQITYDSARFLRLRVDGAALVECALSASAGAAPP